MALPINIEDLLNKRKIEGNRIEFKKGWNPVDIYHSLCAFANFAPGERRVKLAWAMPSQSKVNDVNDFDNFGGGYVLVGVEQDDNDSPRATLETTEDRLTFLIHIPVHEGCDNKPTTETTTETTAEKCEITTEKIPVERHHPPVLPYQQGGAN